jgi:hypothetical protein
MGARLAADAVVLLHVLFVAFVVAGALLLWRWPRLVWLHAPAALWGVFVEWSGTVCPLTPLENRLRARAGEAGYRGGFVEHYVLPWLYPGGLTAEVQFVLGALVAVVNVVAYAAWWWRRSTRAGHAHCRFPPSLPR